MKLEPLPRRDTPMIPPTVSPPQLERAGDEGVERLEPALALLDVLPRQLSERSRLAPSIS